VGWQRQAESSELADGLPIRHRQSLRPCRCHPEQLLSGRMHVHSAESFTPDNMYIMGEAPGMKKLYTACGMNSSGILCGAGVGKKTAEYILKNA